MKEGKRLFRQSRAQRAQPRRAPVVLPQPQEKRGEEKHRRWITRRRNG